MTEDAPSTGTPQGSEPAGTPATPAWSAPPPPPPPPTLTPSDSSTGRPLTEGPAPAPAAPAMETTMVGGPPPGGTATGVLDPPPPTPPATPAAEKPRRPGMGLFPIVVGVGLLGAAIVLESLRSRKDNNDIDWSNYSVGLAATAALLLFAVLALALGSGRGREELVTWPGVAGILGAGAMLGVGLEEIEGGEDWLAYLIGGVVFVLAAIGYAAIRRGAFAVTAILGLGLAYIQLSDDVLVDIGEDDDQAIIAAATVAAFVLVVTAVGWLLRSRALTGIVAGVIGLVGINVVLLVVIVSGVFAGIFGGYDDTYSDTAGTFYVAEGPPDYDNDVYVIFGIAALLTLLWALAAALNGNPGFSVLAILMPATVVPSGTFVLAVEHPTWWGGGLALAGGLLLAAVGLKQLLGRKRQT
ncbi:hypothetical protein [Nocardioides stalactiti]|uniref:hypothetical protein n=1 Tax=Nocardioides stalactiti TaxID=2755356 RepID=UPI0016015D5D|nr:hypothetical protein [Nocardioides stalactiti]